MRFSRTRLPPLLRVSWPAPATPWTLVGEMEAATIWLGAQARVRFEIQPSKEEYWYDRARRLWAPSRKSRVRPRESRSDSLGASWMVNWDR